MMDNLFSPLDAMSATPGPEIPQLTVSPAATSLKAPDIKVEETKPEEKKPVKKRKSWGQELPIPKTNLPPRYVWLHYISLMMTSTNMTSGNELRQKMKKSNVALSGFFGIVLLRRLLGNARGSR